VSRVLELQVEGELTEMGIRITIHSPTARAVYEFAVDDDPDVLWAIIGMSKMIVTQQVEMMVTGEQPDEIKGVVDLDGAKAIDITEIANQILREAKDGS
jgi:hypothetical protein